jgi:Transposase DDE domain
VPAAPLPRQRLRQPERPGRGHGRRLQRPHPPNREEKLDQSGQQRHPARRWVVERTLAWLQKCRAILIRYDKNADNYRGLIQLACALLWYRRLDRLQQVQAF